MITQEQLKQVLHYDPRTGIFTWLESYRSTRIGQEAGNVSGRYRYITIGGVRHLAHRLVYLYMTGAFPSWPYVQIDHINNNKFDNRWENLRAVAGPENSWNRSISSANTSGFKGASYKAKSGKYYSTIGVNGEHIHLGSYDTAEEAAKAYEEAARKVYKEFTRLK
jgi:hypothetical protein